MAKYEAIDEPYRYTVADAPASYVSLHRFVRSGPKREWRNCTTDTDFYNKNFTTCAGAIRHIKKWHGDHLVFDQVSN